MFSISFIKLPVDKNTYILQCQFEKREHFKLISCKIHEKMPKSKLCKYILIRIFRLVNSIFVQNILLLVGSCKMSI